MLTALVKEAVAVRGEHGSKVSKQQYRHLQNQVVISSTCREMLYQSQKFASRISNENRQQWITTKYLHLYTEFARVPLCTAVDRKFLLCIPLSNGYDDDSEYCYDSAKSGSSS